MRRGNIGIATSRAYPCRYLTGYPVGYIIFGSFQPRFASSFEEGAVFHASDSDFVSLRRVIAGDRGL